MALEATASAEHLSYSPSVFELSSTNEALHASLVLLILISCFRGSDGSRNSEEVQIPGYPISMELSFAELKSRFQSYSLSSIWLQFPNLCLLLCWRSQSLLPAQ
jgi:hypothetical protein